MSALVTSEIFREFVNTLTPDDKYSRRYMKILLQQLETPLSQKGEAFFRFFFSLSEMCMKFTTFWKKKKSILAQLLPKSLHPKEIFT